MRFRVRVCPNCAQPRRLTRCREALGEVPGLAEMFVGTIHAFCLELLKSETPKYLKFEVFNEVPGLER